MENLSVVLKQRRKELGLTLAQIADLMGVAEATVQRWESGNIKSVRYEKLDRLAEILKVNPSALMGWEETPTLPRGAIPVPHTTQVPLIGSIACGVPILADQNVEEMVDLPEQIRADFALRCKGESMINAGIRDGDIVYIREQAEVSNGKIAAVMVGDEEATLKRFRKNGDVVVLMPENPEYEVKTFVGEEIQQLRILGLAVGYTHALE